MTQPRSPATPLESEQLETMLDAVLSRAPVGFAFVDRELRYVRVNAHFAAVNGIPAEAHLGRTVREVVPEIAVAVEPMLRQVLDTGEPLLGFEADGSQLGRPMDARVWEASIFPVRGPDAAIVGVGLVVTEITERRRAQEEVRASEAELRALVGALSDVVLVLDRDGRYLKVASTAPDFLYRRREELIGRRLHDVFPGEQADAFLAVIRRALETGLAVETEYTLPIGEQTIWFAATVSPMGEDAVVWVARDITKRKRAEDVLRRQAVVFETIGDAVLVMDLEGRIVDWNPAAVQIFGYSKDEMLGREVVTIHRPELEGQLEKQIQTSLRRHGRWAGELPFRRKDGSDGVADLIVVAQFDEAGHPVAWIGVNRDITARRGAETALAESRALLAAAEELAHVGSWALDPESGRLTWSDELYRIFGMEPQSVSVTSEWFLARVHADDREKVRLAFRRLVDGAEVPSVHCRIVRQDGSERTIQARGRVQREIGDVRRVFGSAQDVTDIVRAERELREALATVAALLNASPLAVTAVDAEDRATMWNQAAERLFGWTAEEVLGRRLPIVSDDYESEHTRLRDQALSGRATDGVQTRRRRKDGSLVDVYASIAPLPGTDGQVRGAVALFVDMTEHRQLEEQLRQSQKMDAVGRLAGGIAHDFNNLLSVIKMYSELLLEQFDDTNPVRPDLVEIHRAAGRAASLTRQLLAFSRKQILQPKVLDLNAIADGIEPMLRRLIGEDIRIVIQRATNIGLVRADPGQLEQVLLNLAVNARDAMPKGGTLSIETANVDLDDEYASRRRMVVPGKYVMLAVSDTGLGMNEAIRSRAFEPFFTTKEVGKGTGLGLSTVYGIVKQSGGYVWVYSEPGKGTTFKIYLPRLDEEASMSPGQLTAALPAGGSEMVLLVEDDDAVRAMTRRILERYGYTVLEAREGRDALRVAGQYPQRIDIMVTDVVMPELSGREVYQRLSKSRPQLRVLYLSGYTDDEIVRRGLLDSTAAFVQKPFTAIHLAGAVRAVLDGRKVPAEAAG